MPITLKIAKEYLARTQNLRTACSADCQCQVCHDLHNRALAMIIAIRTLERAAWSATTDALSLEAEALFLRLDRIYAASDAVAEIDRTFRCVLDEHSMKDGVQKAEE